MPKLLRPEQPKQKRQPTLAFEKVAADIRHKIESGFWREGTLLPSRRNLAKQYGVGLITIERAIAELVAAGVVESEDRRGTFVSKHALKTGIEPADAPGVSDAVSGASRPALFRGTLGGRATSPITLGVIAPIYGSEYDAYEAITKYTDYPLRGCSAHVLWHSTIASSLEAGVCARGSGPVLFANHHLFGADAEPLAGVIDSLLDQGVHAIVINSVYGSYENLDLVDQAVSALRKRPEIPLVFIVSRELPDPVYQVFYDHRYDGYEAADHLLQRGYTRLLFLQPFVEPWLEERFEGAQAAVRHFGLPSETLQIIPDYPIAWSSWEQQRRDQAITASFIKLKEAIAVADSDSVAVIAPNDGTAYRLMHLAIDGGVLPGRDFGLIGFDDDIRSRGVNLSTLRPPLEEVGIEAAQLVFGALTGEQSRRQVRLHSRLIARSSTTRGRLADGASYADGASVTLDPYALRAG